MDPQPAAAKCINSLWLPDDIDLTHVDLNQNRGSMFWDLKLDVMDMFPCFRRVYFSQQMCCEDMLTTPSTGCTSTSASFDLKSVVAWSNPTLFAKSNADSQHGAP